MNDGGNSQCRVLDFASPDRTLGFVCPTLPRSASVPVRSWVPRWPEAACTVAVLPLLPAGVARLQPGAPCGSGCSSPRCHIFVLHCPEGKSLSPPPTNKSPGLTGTPRAGPQAHQDPTLAGRRPHAAGLSRPGPPGHMLLQHGVRNGGWRQPRS